MSQSYSTLLYPMNVQVRKGSIAEKYYTKSSGINVPEIEALADGFPSTPDHNLIRHEGKLVPDMKFLNYFVDGASNWNINETKAIDKAITAAMSSKRLEKVIKQYFPDQKTTCNALQSRTLSIGGVDHIERADVVKLVTGLFEQHDLNGLNLDTTILNFMLPPGIVLAIDAHKSNSLEGLGGYHTSFHHSSGQTLYFSVCVYSETLDDGSTNGIPAFDESWKNVVATAYHEFNEFRTDPDVQDAIEDPANGSKFVGWIANDGREIGDFPIEEADTLTDVFVELPLDGGIKVPIQIMYSNKDNGPSDS